MKRGMVQYVVELTHFFGGGNVNLPFVLQCKYETAEIHAFDWCISDTRLQLVSCRKKNEIRKIYKDRAKKPLARNVFLLNAVSKKQKNSARNW